MRIVRQILDRMPAGDYRIQDKKVTPPPRARIDESMEALIHHFKIFTEGFKVPEGEVYVAIESPRGELGCYLVSDGSAKPYRMHIRGPSFVEPADASAHDARRPHRRRGRHHLVGRPDHGRGRPLDGAASTDENVALGPRDHRAATRSRSRRSSRCSTSPRSRTAGVTDDAMEHIAELLDLTPAEVLGTASFYEMFKREPVGQYLINVCTNIACQLNGGDELLAARRGDARHEGRRHHRRRHVHARRRRVHRRVHRGALPAGELPLPPQDHARRRSIG